MGAQQPWTLSGEHDDVGNGNGDGDTDGDGNGGGDVDGDGAGDLMVMVMVMVTLSGEHDWRMQLIVNDFLFLFLQTNSYALMMGTFTKYFISAHQRAHE